MIKRLLCLVACVLFLALPCEAARWRVWKNATAVGTATFTDDFARADSNPLSLTSSSGGTWQTGVDSTGVFRIQTNKSNGTTGSDNTLRVSAPTFTGQHYAQVTVSTFGGAFYGPCVRVQSSSLFSCYVLYVNNSSTTLTVGKIVDAGGGSLSNTTLGANITVSAMSAGDVIKLDVSGTSTVTLNVYVNGSLVATRTDSTSPLTGGQPGVYSFNTTGQISAYAAADF